MHYRLFMSSDWFTAADLYDDKQNRLFELTLTISRVIRGTLTGEGGKKSQKPTIYFAEKRPDGSDYKPLGCCVENSVAISNVAGTPNPPEWAGSKVTLYVKMIDDKKTRSQRPAVRIKAFREDQQRAAQPSQQQSSQQRREPQRQAVQQQPQQRPTEPPAATSSPTTPQGPPPGPALTDEEKRLEAEYERFKSAGKERA